MTQIKMEKRLFGTNGVRGVAGKDMTPALALSIGMALGSMRKGKIAVGMDTRTSGPALSCAVRAGLLATGCDVVDCGILPTPALQYLVKHHFDGGAVITASHNPPEYNGVKIIEADGTEMGDAETIILEERIFSQNFDMADWQGVGREVAAPFMVDEYIDSVVAAFPPGIGNGLTVIVDPGCGAAAVTTPRILSRLGCRVMTINGQIDGTFPGRLPEPSVEGLKGLTDLVRSSGAAFGVAHDGDADRAVFIDETGRYIEENQEFGLIEQEVCSSRKGAVVTPVSSSRLIEAIAEKYGCNVVYTPVGSIYVARTMIGMLEKGEPVAFGGEGNGGLIYPDHQFCRDGGMTAAMMVAILSRTGEPLSTLVDRLPAFFMIKDKVRVKDPEALIMQMKQAFSTDRLDLTDGVRINRGDTWALIRPSGTEPLVRVMVESGRKEAADLLYQEIIRRVKS